MNNFELKERFCAAFQKLKLEDDFKYINKLKKGGQIKKNKDTIHIKDKNKGKFTASAKAAGESVQKHAKSVLANPNATALQKKRAQFAVNAKKWKHQNGGIIQKFQEAGVMLPPELAGMNYANAKRYWEALGDMDPRQKAGILGNIYVESKMNPTAENASYKGLTQLGKKSLGKGVAPRYSWVVNNYGSGGDNEMRYVIDYVKGKLVKNSNFGYGSKQYIAGHTGDYTVDDSTNLFRRWYEGTSHNSVGRRNAANAIYKLFNVETPTTVEKPLSTPLSEYPKPSIIEQPNATVITKPQLPIQLRR